MARHACIASDQWNVCAAVYEQFSRVHIGGDAGDCVTTADRPCMHNEPELIALETVLAQLDCVSA